MFPSFSRFFHNRKFFNILSPLFPDGLVRKRSQMHLASSRSSGELRVIKKSSSCSTIYIDDSTVSQPNLKNTIKVVSLAIYYNIKNRTSNQVLDIFDEKTHPLTVRKTKIWLVHLFARDILLMKKLEIEETKTTQHSTFKKYNKSEFNFFDFQLLH